MREEEKEAEELGQPIKEKKPMGIKVGNYVMLAYGIIWGIMALLLVLAMVANFIGMYGVSKEDKLLISGDDASAFARCLESEGV